jgi:hypothetical protein
MQWFRRILVHLCSILLATPIGWCCWLPVVQAAEKAEEADCCCCTAKEKPAPAKSREAPSRAPTCCCDPQPGVSSASDVTGKAPAPALPAVLVSFSSVAALSSALALAPPSLHDPSPPLHILHCLWLC